MSNENGKLLISFARSRDMKVKSNFFQRKEIYTWRSPDGRVVNRIDHVLMDSRNERCITNVRTYRGPDTNSDHYLVGIKMI